MSRLSRLSLFCLALASGLGFSVHAQPIYEYRTGVPTLQVLPPGDGEAALSSASVDFGTVAAHSTETRQVVVLNEGDGVLHWTAPPAVSGHSAFSAGATSCSTQLLPGQSCLTEVTFTPTTLGSFNGLLTFTSTLANSPHQVTLSGVAFNPVSLASTTLPVAKVGQAYSFDFKPLLNISNEANPDKSLATWSGSGTLPAGLSLSTSTGLLTGTPSVPNPGTSYTVTGTYKNNQGQQVYTIVVKDTQFDVVSISQGGMHACAVVVSGAVYCWGYYNGSGSHGTGDFLSSPTPRQVVGLTNAVQVSAGHDHTCARTSAGAAFCWGEGQGGRLGNGSTATRNTPVAVTNMGSGVTHIAAGAGSTCAIRNGAAFCWGGGFAGKLGNNSTADSSVPVQVSGLTSGVTDIDVDIGMHSACAVHNGAAKCWGYNASGNLGEGTNTERRTPVQVVGLTSGVTSIDAGSSHVCAVHNGVPKCWGANGSGQLGDGTTTGRTTPVSVQGLPGTASKVGAAGSTSCALTTAGTMHCWGAAARLGTGASSNSPVAVAVSGLGQTVTSMAVGNMSNCAVLADGETRCWGTRAASGTAATTSGAEPLPQPILWPNN